jgi:hypothetical protein
MVLVVRVAGQERADEARPFLDEAAVLFNVENGSRRLITVHACTITEADDLAVYRQPRVMSVEVVCETHALSEDNKRGIATG